MPLIMNISLFMTRIDREHNCGDLIIFSSGRPSPGAATVGMHERGAGLGQFENGLGKSGREGGGARGEDGFGLVSVRAIQWCLNLEVRRYW